jgi:hypothetical protein
LTRTVVRGAGSATTRRIHRRILKRCPGTAVAEPTVLKHLREHKRQIAPERRERSVLQTYSWAQEAQVDWYEACGDFGDERTKVPAFAMHSVASGAPPSNLSACNAAGLPGGARARVHPLPYASTALADADGLKGVSRSASRTDYRRSAAAMADSVVATRALR